jgi:hypothetical protein
MSRSVLNADHSSATAEGISFALLGLHLCDRTWLFYPGHQESICISKTGANLLLTLL